MRPYVGPYANVKFILVDPSCSGSGTLKSQNKKYTKTEISNFVINQICLLNHALSFPKVQKVVYSTCSILPQVYF